MFLLSRMIMLPSLLLYWPLFHRLMKYIFKYVIYVDIDVDYI